MPYIITTIGDPHEPRERIAVATLDQAQTHIELLGATRMRDVVSSEGGSINLPDGTVIEVRSTHWEDLRHAAGLDFPTSRHERADILAAFNAA